MLLRTYTRLLLLNTHRHEHRPIIIRIPALLVCFQTKTQM